MAEGTGCGPPCRSSVGGGRWSRRMSPGAADGPVIEAGLCTPVLSLWSCQDETGFHPVKRRFTADGAVYGPDSSTRSWCARQHPGYAPGLPLRRGRFLLVALSVSRLRSKQTDAGDWNRRCALVFPSIISLHRSLRFAHSLTADVVRGWASCRWSRRSSAMLRLWSTLVSLADDRRVRSKRAGAGRAGGVDRIGERDREPPQKTPSQKAPDLFASGSPKSPSWRCRLGPDSRHSPIIGPVTFGQSTGTQD